MGLDMYLERRKYIGNQYKKEDEKVRVKFPDDVNIDENKISSITEEVGYWRKANQIHNWFVKNVQEGEDDCKDYYVSINDLRRLYDTVCVVLESSKLIDGDVTNGYTFKDGKQVPIIEKGKIIEDPSVAKLLLPNSGGFFFGSQEYDEYYIHDLERTKEIIEKILNEKPDYKDSFYYSSSW